MARLGMRPGRDDTTVLWMPLDRGVLTDLSGQAQTITSSSPAPTRARGYYAEARTYDGTAYDQVAASASLDFAGTFTAQAMVKLTGSLAERAIIGRFDNGSGNAWQLWGGHSAYALKATVWNSVGTSDSLQVSTHLLTLDSGRWYHVALVFTVSASIALYIDGQLVAYKTTTLANVRSTSVAALKIGTATTYSGWIGQIGDVHVCTRALAESELAPNLAPDRITRRQVYAYDVELGQMLQDESWTDDGASHSVAQADFALGTFITAEQDVIGVEVATAAGVKTTLTKAYNTTDVDATNNSFMWDEAAAKLRVRIGADVDPATYAVVRARIRYRAATHGWRGGDRWYRPAVLSAEPGELRTAYIFEPYPTGGGGQFRLARQFADHPTGFGSEEAAAVMWTNARVRVRLVSDDMPWAEAIDAFTGRVERSPDDDRDEIAVQVVAEYGRLAKAEAGTVTLSVVDYPDLPEQSIGKALSTVWGPGLQRVEAYCVDTKTPLLLTFSTGQTDYFYKYRVTGHKVTGIGRVWYGNTYVIISDVDLNAGTFYANMSGARVGQPVMVDVDGYGTTSSPTSAANTPIHRWGSVSDTIVLPEVWLKEWLMLYVGAAAADFDSTFATTGARVRVSRHWAEVLTGADSVGEEFHRFKDETLTFPYQNRNGTWGWRDVNKAEANEWNIFDWDVVTSRRYYDSAQIASEAQASAYEERVDAEGVLHKGAPTSLALEAGQRYDALRTWYPPPGSSLESLSRFLSRGTLDTWLGLVRRFLEEPSPLWDVEVVARFADIDLMDVATDRTGDAPVAAARWRVLSRKPLANGLIALTLFVETPFPTDASSVAVIRNAYRPIQCWRLEGVDTGISCPNVGAWTVVGTNVGLYLGATLPQPTSGVTNTLVVRAVRVGGAADTDFQVRLVNLDTGAAIATISAGFGVAAEFKSVAVTVPTTDCRLQLQYNTTGGASGTVYSASWEAEETTVTVGEPVSPTLGWTTGKSTGWTLAANTRDDSYRPTTQFAWGQSTGVSGLATAAWTTVGTVERPWMLIDGFPTGTVHSFAVYGLRAGGTDVEFRLWDATNSAAIASLSVTSTTNAFTATASVTPPTTDCRIVLQYKANGGASGTIYEATWQANSTNAAPAALPEATLFYADGDSGGKVVSVSGDVWPFRVGLLDLQGSATAPITLWACFYVNIGTATAFVPRVLLYGTKSSYPYVRQEYVAATFPTITATGFYAITITTPPGVPYRPFEVYFDSTLSGGSATVYGIGLFARHRNETPTTQNELYIGTMRHGMHWGGGWGQGSGYWAMYVDPAGAVGLHPRVVSADGVVMADFGTITGAARIVTAIGSSEPGFFATRYKLTSGSPIIYAIAAFPVWPESGNG